jgi:hypothetical protein
MGAAWGYGWDVIRIWVGRGDVIGMIFPGVFNWIDYNPSSNNFYKLFILNQKFQ